MIARGELSRIGHIIKTHGVQGEMVALLDVEISEDDPKFIFLHLDGLYVPFRITAIRPRSSESVLVRLKGIDSADAAAALAGKDIFIEKSSIEDVDEPDDNGQIYLEDLIGYCVVADGIIIGEIDDYDDSTENILFTLHTPSGQSLMIPAAADLIEDVSPETRTLTMTLPEGLLNIN